TLVMHPPVLFSTSIYQNVAFAARSRGARGNALPDAVRDALREVNMEGWERRHAGRLSAGEKKRVSIARALAFKPDVLCIDEPVADLDPENMGIIENILLDIRNMGIALVFTTLRRKRSFGIADEIVYLENGKIEEIRLDNLFRAEFSEKEGTFVARLAGGGEIAVPPNEKREGRVHIDPAAIILSPSPFTSSARNSLPGKVKSVEDIRGQIRVTIDAGAEFVTLITPKSMDELGIRPGAGTYVTFKVSSVKIF
ncbi:MAG: ATP-binding cassette domain-containing protein, partial [bacterium]